MAQPIKYNTGAKTANCCIRKGNYDIGIVPTYTYGPTAGTGFWAGYSGGTIPTGGFISYQNKASQGPSIYVMQDINEVVAYGENLNIGIQSTPEDVFYACANLTTIALVNIDYPNIPYQGGLLTLDAGYTASNPWTGADWFDITGNENTGTFNGNAAFSSGNTLVNYSDSRVSLQAVNEDSWVSVPAFAGTLSNFTVNVVLNSGGNGYGQEINVVGQQYSNSPVYTPQSNCNFLIRGNGTDGYQGLIRVSGVDYTVNFGAAGGGWRAFTLTWDGNELRAYSDGVLSGLNVTGPLAGLTSNGLPTIIGGTTNASESSGAVKYFDGGINVVNIYDVCLNSSEVTDLYNSYSGRF